MAQLDADLKDTMSASLKAYSAGSAKWFDFLADNITVYSVGSAQPFKGKAAYEKHFEKQLTSTKRKVTIVHQSTQAMGDRTVVAQTLQILQDAVVFNVRQSVVWSKAESKWQMSHLHTALVGNPVGTKAASNASAINVLNEKIATIAAVCGVAQ